MIAPNTVDFRVEELSISVIVCPPGQEPLMAEELALANIDSDLWFASLGP